MKDNGFTICTHLVQGFAHVIIQDVSFGYILTMILKNVLHLCRNHQKNYHGAALQPATMTWSFQKSVSS